MTEPDPIAADPEAAAATPAADPPAPGRLAAALVGRAVCKVVLFPWQIVRRLLAAGAQALRWLCRGVRAVAADLTGARRLLHEARMTLVGGWHDIRPVAARIAAPLREAAASARAAGARARHRVRVQLTGLRAGLRRRR